MLDACQMEKMLYDQCVTMPTSSSPDFSAPTVGAEKSGDEDVGIVTH